MAVKFGYTVVTVLTLTIIFLRVVQPAKQKYPYDKPKELSEFHKRCNDIYGCGAMPPLTRPPQSWCYVEESEVKNDL